MKKPFFSIVIPTLNEEKDLPHLLRDIHQQTFREIEIIVVDGSSNDSTVRLAGTFHSVDLKQYVIISQRRHVGVQRNMGARRAAGKVLLFLDADSRIPSFFLEGIHYQLLRHRYDLWTSWARADSSEGKDKVLAYATNLLFEAGKSTGFPMAVGACLGCRAAVFAKLKGFDEEMALGEDYDFVRRATKLGYHFHIFRDPQFVYSFRRVKMNGTFKQTAYSLQVLAALLRNEKITDPTIYPMLGGSFFRQRKTPKGISYELTQNARKFKTILKENQRVFEKMLSYLLD